MILKGHCFLDFTWSSSIVLPPPPQSVDGPRRRFYRAWWIGSPAPRSGNACPPSWGGVAILRHVCGGGARARGVLEPVGVGAVPARAAKTCLRTVRTRPRPTLRGALLRALGLSSRWGPRPSSCPDAGKSEAIPPSLGRQRPHYLVLWLSECACAAEGAPVRQTAAARGCSLRAQPRRLPQGLSQDHSFQVFGRQGNGPTLALR